jgi:hypothetical protein
MQYMFKFYLQIFAHVQCGFLVSCGRFPICKWFCPKSFESCPHPRLQLLLSSMPIILSDLQKEVEQKLCLQLIPTQKSPGVLNQVTMVAKLSFSYVQSVVTGRISKQLCVSGMPLCSLDKNVRTRRNF